MFTFITLKSQDGASLCHELHVRMDAIHMIGDETSPDKLVLHCGKVIELEDGTGEIIKQMFQANNPFFPVGIPVQASDPRQYHPSGRALTNEEFQAGRTS